MGTGDNMGKQTTAEKRLKLAIDETQALVRAAKQIVKSEIGGVEQDDPRWVLPVLDHLIERERAYRDTYWVDL